MRAAAEKVHRMRALMTEARGACLSICMSQSMPPGVPPFSQSTVWRIQNGRILPVSSCLNRAAHSVFVIIWRTARDSYRSERCAAARIRRCAGDRAEYSTHSRADQITAAALQRQWAGREQEWRGCAEAHGVYAHSRAARGGDHGL